MARVIIRFENTIAVRVMTIADAQRYKVYREDLVRERGGEIQITLV